MWSQNIAILPLGQINSSTCALETIPSQFLRTHHPKLVSLPVFRHFTFYAKRIVTVLVGSDYVLLSPSLQSQASGRTVDCSFLPLSHPPLPLQVTVPWLSSLMPLKPLLPKSLFISKPIDIILPYSSWLFMTFETVFFLETAVPLTLCYTILVFLFLPWLLKGFLMHYARW